MIEPGCDLPGIIASSIKCAGLVLEKGDVVAVAQSVVSKAEGRVVNLKEVSPGERAKRIAEQTGKDAREVEVILRESLELVRVAHVIISRTRHGYVCANAGVDRSNAPPDHVTLLPEDPDESARRIRDRLRQEFGVEVAVIITDTQGRPFREGAVGCAVGISGMEAFLDFREKDDLYGRKLRTAVLCTADAIAAAAVLAMGEAGEGTPVVIVRGAPYVEGEGKAGEMVRPRERDLFGSEGKGFSG